MPHQRPPTRHVDRILLLFLLGLFFFASPFTHWWMDQQFGWYTPYLLWLVLIVLAALVQRGQARDGA